jgi:hypothetical protein
MTPAPCGSRPAKEGALAVAFNFAGDLVALFAQRYGLMSQTRGPDCCYLSTACGQSPLAERLNDFGRRR